MRRSAWFGAVLLVALLIASPAGAQSSLEIEGVDTDTYPRVSIEVVAPSVPGVDELVPGDFSVTEAGVPKSFELVRLGGIELELVLVLDVSGSMAGQPLTAAKEAAVGFLDQLPSAAGVAVVAFGSTPRVVAPFAATPEERREAIEGLSVAGETALYDALLLALEQFPDGGSAERAIVVLSDGGDTVSQATFEEAIGVLGARTVPVYAIELQSPESDPAALSQLAEASGGRTVRAEDPEALASVYESVAALLTNRYRITYTSEARGRAEVVVELSRGDVAATAKRIVSFPAPPVPSDPEPGSVSEPVGGDQEGVVLPEPGWLARWGLVAGIGAVYVALAIMLFSLLLPGRHRVRLSFGDFRERGPRRTAISELADRTVFLAERALQQSGRFGGLNAALERAGLLLRPGEFLVLVGSGSLAAMAVGMILSGSLLGFLLVAIVLLGSRLHLSLRRDRRQAAFVDQLGDTLQLLAGTLRSGYGVLQAIDIVSREAEPPTSEELRRVVLENRLGRDLVEALRAVVKRVESVDFEWVVEAIEIHQDVGGDLAEVLDAVAATIRDRNQIRRQVKALSAEGRLSAIILILLPIVMAAFISITNPAYMGELTGSTAGRIMIAAGVVLTVVGGLWMRRVVDVEF